VRAVKVNAVSIEHKNPEIGLAHAKLAIALTRLNAQVRVALAQEVELLAAAALGPLPTPPRSAELIMRLALPSKTRVALLGDLQEEFEEEMVPRHGAAWAKVWYWKQAAAAVWQLVPFRVMRWGLYATGITRLISYLKGSV